jgi:hypothetical protein
LGHVRAGKPRGQVVGDPLEEPGIADGPESLEHHPGQAEVAVRPQAVTSLGPGLGVGPAPDMDRDGERRGVSADLLAA